MHQRWKIHFWNATFSTKWRSLNTGFFRTFFIVQKRHTHTKYYYYVYILSFSEPEVMTTFLQRFSWDDWQLHAYWRLSLTNWTHFLNKNLTYTNQLEQIETRPNKEFGWNHELQYILKILSYLLSVLKFSVSICLYFSHSYHQ